MPYPSRPPTSQGVSAALKRAGFNRSVVRAGSGRYHHDGRLVRGSQQFTAGYAVKTEDGQIRVRYRIGAPGAINDELAKRRTLMLLRYADALLLAGFRSQLSSDGTKLTVYARRG